MICIRLSALFAAACILAAQQSDPAGNRILELSARPTIVPEPWHGHGPPPEPVWQGVVEVTVKSISPLKICIYESELTYEISVVDSEGHPVPKTEHGEQVAACQRSGVCPTFAVASNHLSPGQIYTSQLALRGLFKIQPGQDYTVTLKRWKPSVLIFDAEDHVVSRLLADVSVTIRAPARPAAP